VRYTGARESGHGPRLVACSFGGAKAASPARKAATCSHTAPICVRHPSRESNLPGSCYDAFGGFGTTLHSSGKEQRFPAKLPKCGADISKRIVGLVCLRRQISRVLEGASKE
jgi:hypothetical protein